MMLVFDMGFKQEIREAHLVNVGGDVLNRDLMGGGLDLR